jgi:hypothetical protein
MVKISPNIWVISVIKKTAQSKQSPNRRKFVQSGHPGCEQELSGVVFEIFYRRRQYFQMDGRYVGNNIFFK